MQKGNKATRDAFARTVVSWKKSVDTGNILEIMDAFRYEGTREMEAQNARLRAGLDLFADIGSLRPANRECNLRLLPQLLQQPVCRWQQVEFSSSDGMGNIMNVEP